MSTYEEIVGAQRGYTVAPGAPPSHQLARKRRAAEQKAEKSDGRRVGEGAPEITLNRFLRRQVQLLEEFCGPVVSIHWGPSCRG